MYPNPLRLSTGTMAFTYRLSASQIADSVALEIFTTAGARLSIKTHIKMYSQKENLSGAAEILAALLSHLVSISIVSLRINQHLMSKK